MKKMIASLMVLLAAAPLAAKKKAGGEDLSNMIIQGENRLKVEPVVPPVEWTPPVHRDAGAVIQNYTLVGEMTPPSIEEPPVILPEKSVSVKTAVPWLERIFEPPVLRLSFKAPEGAKGVEWTFLVKDAEGKVFYEHKDKKAIPKDVVWEGFNANRVPLRVGQDYAYSFSIMDEGGNPQRFAGKPFRLDAFRYPEGLRTVTLVNADVLFDAKYSLKFSKDGLEYLEEIKDSLRHRYGNKVEILCVEDDAAFAGYRARALKDWFVKTLDWEEVLITAQSQSTAKGGGYRHVEITAK